MLLASLVGSRLMFNAHIVVPSAKYIRTLNPVYMRVLRRICDNCRFGHSENDLLVRQSADVPSVDCLLLRARLKYLARVCRHKLDTLRALLAAEPKGEQNAMDSASHCRHAMHEG